MTRNEKRQVMNAQRPARNDRVRASGALFGAMVLVGVLLYTVYLELGWPGGAVSPAFLAIDGVVGVFAALSVAVGLHYLRRTPG
jgi:hypothetical protein